MINMSKITNSFNNNPIAGLLPNDNSIEFYGVRQTKQVIWLQNGCSRYFQDLPVQFYALLKTAYLKDHKAQNFLKEITSHLPRQVELFTYYMYGELNPTPDIINGVLGPAENFRDKEACPSLLWDSKTMKIGTHELTPRQLLIIDLMAKGLADKQIAPIMGIAVTTLDNHKQNLFKSINAYSKYDVLRLAFQSKILA